jgi:MGT family glycosyltransferase
MVGGMDPVVPHLERELDVPVVYLSAVFLQNARTLTHMLRICRDLPAAAGFLMRHRTLTRSLSPMLSQTLMGTRVADLLDMFGPQSSTLNIVFTSRDFQPFPDDFDDTCLFVGPTPTRSLPDPTFPMDRLRDHDGTVVYATLGTVYNTWTHFFRAVIDAFEGSDTLVVIAAGHTDRVREIGTVPSNVILRPFVPQADVLSNADLIIAHGGMGTVSDAIAYQVPSILTPLAADQFFNAYRLEEFGAGRVISKGHFDSDAVREAATSVLTDDAGRAAVNQLRDSFRSAGGSKAAVSAIDAILTSHHLGRRSKPQA